MPRMRRRSRPITPSVIAAARIKNITLKTRFFRNLLGAALVFQIALWGRARIPPINFLRGLASGKVVAEKRRFPQICT
jgi:hypothetical protein